MVAGGGGAARVRLCKCVLTHTAEIIGEIFSVLCSYLVQTWVDAEENIFHTESKRKENYARCCANETHRPRLNTWTELPREASALQQLRNSVKHANVRVGGEKRRRREERPLRDPLATSSSDPSLSNTTGDAERDRDGTKPAFVQLCLLKKRGIETAKK